MAEVTKEQFDSEHERLVAASVATATATVERAEAVSYGRKINGVLAIATIMAVSYGVGMTVSSLTIGDSMRQQISRIEKDGTQTSRKNSEDIARLQTQWMSIEKQLGRIEAALDNQTRVTRQSAINNQKSAIE